MSGKEFVDRVNLLFPKTGKHKSDFYEYCGIASNSLSLWASRDTIPRADIALKIAKFLDTSVEYLVTGKEENIPKQVLDLAYEIYALPEVYRKIVLDTVNTLKTDVSEKAQAEQQNIG